MTERYAIVWWMNDWGPRWTTLVYARDTPDEAIRTYIRGDWDPRWVPSAVVESRAEAVRALGKLRSKAGLDARVLVAVPVSVARKLIRANES